MKSWGYANPVKDSEMDMQMSAEKAEEGKQHK